MVKFRLHQRWNSNLIEIERPSNLNCPFYDQGKGAKPSAVVAEKDLLSIETLRWENLFIIC
jgi:hypothetical protein